MLHVRFLRAPLLWTAFVLFPAAGWGVLHGVPLDRFSAFVVFAIWWSWYFGGLLPGRWLLISLLLVKALAGPFLFVDRGFRAEHFANEHWMRGYFWVRSPQDRQDVYLAGKNVIGEFWIDGTEAVRLEPPSNEAVASAPWPSGMRRLTIRVSGGSAQRVEAGVVDASGRKLPFDEADVFASPVTAWRLAVDRTTHGVTTLVDGALLIVLAWSFGVTLLGVCVRAGGTSRHEDLLALASLAAMTGGVRWLITVALALGLMRAVAFLAPPEEQ